MRQAAVAVTAISSKAGRNSSFNHVVSDVTTSVNQPSHTGSRLKHQLLRRRNFTAGWQALTSVKEPVDSNRFTFAWCLSEAPSNILPLHLFWTSPRICFCGASAWNEAPLCRHCESVSVTIASKFVHNFNRGFDIGAIRFSPTRSQFNLALIQIRGGGDAAFFCSRRQSCSTIYPKASSLLTCIKGIISMLVFWFLKSDERPAESLWKVHTEFTGRPLLLHKRQARRV